MKLLLKDANGDSVCVSVLPGDTFLDLMKRIAEEDNIDVDIQDFRIEDQPIENHLNVYEYFKVEIKAGENLETEKNDKWACAAKYCTNSSANTPDKAVFNFPLDQERCLEWMTAINREDLQNALDQLDQNYVVCEDHFVDGNDDPTTESRCLTRVSGDGGAIENERELCRLCAESYHHSDLSDIFQIMDQISLFLPLKIEANDRLSKLVCSSCVDKVTACKDFIDECLEAERRQLEIHEQQKQTEKKCPICSKKNLDDASFLSTSEFFEALEKHNEVCLKNEKNPAPEVGESENETDVHCSVCRKKVPLLSCLNGKCHDLNIFPCFLCDVILNSSQELREHLKQHLFVINGVSKLNENSVMWKCGKCGVRFSDMISFEEHITCHKGNKTKPEQKRKTFRCEICSKSFRCEDRLEFHKQFHTKGAQAGKCAECKKEFPSELCLYKHMLYNHLAPKVFTCEKCGKTFRNKSSLTYHSRSHTSFEAMRPFTCDLCQRRFARKNILRDHLTIQHGTELTPKMQTCFQCRACKEVFPNTNSAISHMEIHHPDQVDENTGYSFDMLSLNMLFVCEFCDKSFSVPIDLIKHKTLHNQPSRYQCKICNEEFASAVELRTHKNAHAADGIADYKSEFRFSVLYICEFCEKCFKSYLTLMVHCSSHDGENPYRCRFCSFQVSSYESLVDHRLNQHPFESSSSISDFLKPFQCNYCDKAFISESSLTKHVRSHTGERPFPCKLCNKSFSQSSGLYTHMKSHSTERPYQCDLCSRSFKIIGDYKMHVRKHSGIRPYLCDACPKTFMTLGACSQHKKTHLDARPFECEICHETFGRAHTLRTHRRKHEEGANSSEK